MPPRLLKNKREIMKNKKMGRPLKFSLDKKIYRLVDKNPRRKGTKAYENFKLMRSGKTIKKFISDGGDMKDFHYCFNKKFIKIK